MVSFTINNTWQEIIPPDAIGIISNENDFKINVAILPASPTNENFFTYNAYQKIAFYIPDGSKLFIKTNGIIKKGKIRVDEDNLFAVPSITKILGSDNDLIDGVDGALRVLAGYGDLSQDAWGRQKVVNDFSLFHGVWTVDIPDVMWIEFYNGAEQVKTNATSVDGAMNLTSNGGEAFLSSKRHPRYQPNRGHLYSGSILLPNKTALAQRDFGLVNAQFGAFFRLREGVLYACIRTTTTALVTTTTEELIDLTNFSDSFDVEKGNIYDIQMQWRGVGNIKFFIGNPDTGLSELVHSMDLLGKLTGLSIGNPAMPIGFVSKNLGDDAVIQAGCVDISSEGGFKENRQRGVIISEEQSISTTETPMLLLHVPDVTTNGWINTRDIAMRRIRGYADANTLIRVYYTRDATVFTGTVFTSNDAQNTSEFSANGDIVWNGGGRQVNEDRIPAFGSVSLDNPDEVYGDFYLTHGDYFLVTLQSKNNTLGGASLEWGAEV